LPNFQKKGDFFKLREEGYPKLHKGMTEGGVGPLQPKKKLLQNGFIENMKPKAQI